MNILKRQKINPVTLISGDSIVMQYIDEFGNTTEHARHMVTENHTFDEALIFEDVIDGKNAIGGAWLEQDG